MSDATTRPSTHNLGRNTIGDCSFCADKEIPVAQGWSVQICLKCARMAAEIHGVSVPEKSDQELMDEALGRCQARAAKRVVDWIERAAKVGAKLESSALTWLDAKMLQNRKMLVEEHWRSGRWWVVMPPTKTAPPPAPDTGATPSTPSTPRIQPRIKGTAFVSRSAAMEAAEYEPGDVVEVHFASMKEDRKADVDPLTVLLGVLGLGTAGALKALFGRKR